MTPHGTVSKKLQQQPYDRNWQTASKVQERRMWVRTTRQHTVDLNASRMPAEGASAQPSVPQFLQTTSIFTSNTSESCVGSHTTHKKVWQRLKFLNQEDEHENLIVAELNLRIVVNKVKLPCINKLSTGRIREGLCKDNISKDPFSQCELYNEFASRSKWSTWLQRQECN